MQNQNIFHIYNKGFLLKFFLFIFILSSNLRADSLMIIKNNVRVNWCITDSYYFEDDKIRFYNTYAPTVKSTLDKSNVVEIKSGYEYNPNTNTCDLIIIETPTNPTPDENGLIMGMKETDFHLAMALWGVSLSFLMSIGLIISF